MLVFNNTDVPVDFRDRVILPGMSLSFPDVTEQVLTPDERRVFRSGALGKGVGKTIRLRERLRIPIKASPPVVSLSRLNVLL